jgi:biopolymer transport protein ExbD
LLQAAIINMKLQVAKKVHYDSGPNMTPLVDIVMVILIFLMLCGSFVGSEHFLVSNLPISQGGVGGKPPPVGFIPDEPIEIRVDSRGAGAFVATAGKIRTDDPNVLTAKLRQMRMDLTAIGKTDDQIQVKIGPGKNVKYQELVKVYEAALQAGYKKVAFARSH